MADRRLQVFHAVAKHLSFTKAAEALFMTQPAVTFQVKQLEEHFNTRLFERGHGRNSLTPAGLMVLEYAEKILTLSAELDLRLKEMTGEVGGLLLVGASTTIAEFLLPQVLGDFKSKYPKVQPRLAVANSETVENRVAEHTIDIGFIEAPSHRDSVVTDICCEDELQAVCAPSHPLARLKSATPKQLVQYPFISREAGSGTREVIDQYLQASGVAPDALNVVMELGSPEALKGLVATGLGFTILSRAAVVKETRLGQLVRVPLAPRLIRNFSVVYPKEKFRSRLVNTFVQFAKERLAALQAP
ncbi:MAG: LysR family transcriptional regulator [Betaproteobacteria bacterium RIFCSPLOWO2_02_FULL_67_19]|nr:MAG: LysR family transcriptional regulator [Betaproteobacteria bacterium RIFCSPLOWO2_02_FULL_67_19]